MKIIITESQKKFLLREIKEDEVRNEIKEAIEKNIKISKKIYDDISEIFKDSKEQMGSSFQFLLTWGASIGGFIRPIDQYLRGEYPELNSLEVTSILIGIISTHLFENKDLNKKIIKKIKEYGLKEKFDKVSKKSEQLKETFALFIESLGVTFHRITHMISYIFILPIIQIIYNMVHDGNFDVTNIKTLVNRLLSFGAVSVSGIMFKQLLTKMIRRFISK